MVHEAFEHDSTQWFARAGRLTVFASQKNLGTKPCTMNTSYQKAKTQKTIKLKTKPITINANPRRCYFMTKNGKKQSAPNPLPIRMRFAISWMKLNKV